MGVTVMMSCIDVMEYLPEQEDGIISSLEK